MSLSDVKANIWNSPVTASAWLTLSLGTDLEEMTSIKRSSDIFSGEVAQEWLVMRCTAWSSEGRGSEERSLSSRDTFIHTITSDNLFLRLRLLVLPTSAHGSPLSCSYSPGLGLVPGGKSVIGLEGLHSLRPLRGQSVSSNLPIGLSVHSSWSQMHLNLLLVFALSSHDLDSTEFVGLIFQLSPAGCCCHVRCYEFGLCLGRFVRKHAKFSSSSLAWRLRESLVAIEYDADEFPVWVSCGISVICDIARCTSVDGVVASLRQ